MIKRLLLSLLLVLNTIIPVGAHTNYIQAVNTSGQTLYYTMDDDDINGTTIYNKAGTTNGTLVNTPTTGSTGVLKEAVTFDGSTEYINSGVSATTSGTLSCWFKSNSLGEDAIFFGQKGITNGRSYLSYNPSKVISGGVGDVNYSTIAGTTVVTAGVWYHIAITWNGSNVYLYCNGVQEYTAAQTGAVETTNSLFIGATNNNGSASNWLNGLIDEPRAYNRALSATEVLNIYNATKRNYIQAQDNTNLVGQWSLGTADISGATVYGNGTSDQLTAVASPTLVSGFDGRANQALSFNGTTQYLTQKFHDTQQGTLTASMVAGTAFINDSGQDFSPYVGVSGQSKPYMIVATDSTGLKAWGYIGEQGTGETLGDTLVTNGTFDSDITGWTNGSLGSNGYNTFEWDATGKLHAAFTSGTIEAMGQNSISVTSGKLYKVTFDITVTSGQNPSVAIRSVILGTAVKVPLTTITGTGSYSGYFTANAATAAIEFRNTAASDFTIDNVVIKEVSTPFSTGVKIYSTKTGSTQSWANIATGFNANSISSYGIRKTDFQITGAITVGAWVNSSTNNIVYAVSKYDTGYSQRSWAFGHHDVTTPDKMRVLLSGIGSAFQKYYITSLDVFDGNWHFFIFTYDGNNNLKIYVDGVEDINVVKNTDTAMTTLFDSFSPLLIGGALNSGVIVNYFPGPIDEPFVYDRVLSDTEVLNLYNSQKRKFIQ